MKDGVLLLIIGVIGIGGIVLWRAMDPFSSDRYLNQHSELRPENPPSLPVAKPDKPHKPTAVAKVQPVVEAAPVSAEPPVAAVPPAPPVILPDPPPFPAVDQIASGEPEQTVTGKYGDPAISAFTSSGGHMVGTYVYARDRGRVATVIHLEDGVVASATAKSSPPPVAGLSIPRHNKQPE